MASVRSGRGFALVLVLSLVVTACSDDATDGGAETPQPPTVPTDATTTTAQPAEVIEWVGTDLPPASGFMSILDETGVYFAVIDRTYHLVAVDLTDGSERWRHPVDPHNRIPHIVETPTLDPAEGLVYATTLTDDEAQLAAFDVVSGELIWETLTSWAGTTPSLCGRWVCVDDSRSTHVVFHAPTTGEIVRSLEGGREYTIAFADGFQLSGDPVGGSIELGRFTAAGYESLWTIPMNELVGSEVADRYGPENGSEGIIDPESGRVVFRLFPPCCEDGVRVEDLGSVVAAVGPDGSIITSVYPETNCHDGRLDAPTYVVCEGFDASSFEDVDGDGIEDPNITTDRLVLYDFVTGAVVSRAQLPGRTYPDPDYVRFTSDPKLMAALVDGIPYLVDLATGTAEPIDDSAPAVLTRCTANHDLWVDSNEEIDGWYGTDSYRAMDPWTIAGLCDLDDQPVDPAEVLRAGGQIPAWFGISSRAVDAHNHLGFHIGPVVWVDEDRILHTAWRR